jgi:hypothetical protein
MHQLLLLHKCLRTLRRRRATPGQCLRVAAADVLQRLALRLRALFEAFLGFLVPLGQLVSQNLTSCGGLRRTRYVYKYTNLPS